MVTATAKFILKGLGFDTRAAYQALSAASLKAAIREQGLAPLVDELRRIVPDIADQYTAGFDRDEYERYWEVKMRGLHAFQVRCIIDTLDHLGGEGLVIADVGDSSGNHAAYVKALCLPSQVARIVSLNLDPVALEKIRAKGGEGILCRAEELDHDVLKPDLVITFETMEHLIDPIRFLHRLATKGSAEYLLMSVPYRRDSRFGSVHIRLPEHQMPDTLTAEQVHVFELSPEDWRLLARFAGFETVFSRIYRQYPLRSPLRVTAPLWRKLDFEGFLALFLRRDLGVARRYQNWEAAGVNPQA